MPRLTLHVSRGPLNAGRALLIAAFVIAVLMPASARAGSYVLYSCQHPDGSSAPTEGWVPFSVGGGSTLECRTNQGALSAVIPHGSVSAGAGAGWTWTGRGDVRLRSFVLRRSY